MDLILKIIAPISVLLTGIILTMEIGSSDALEDEIYALKKHIKNDHAQIKMLGVERDFLSNPVTLERLNDKYLKLVKIAPAQIVTDFENVGFRKTPLKVILASVEEYDLSLPREKPKFRKVKWSAPLIVQKTPYENKMKIKRKEPQNFTVITAAYRPQKQQSFQEKITILKPKRKLNFSEKIKLRASKTGIN